MGDNRTLALGHIATFEKHQFSQRIFHNFHPIRFSIDETPSTNSIAPIFVQLFCEITFRFFEIAKAIVAMYFLKERGYSEKELKMATMLNYQNKLAAICGLRNEAQTKLTASGTQASLLTFWETSRGSLRGWTLRGDRFEGILRMGRTIYEEPFRWLPIHFLKREATKNGTTVTPSVDSPLNN